MIEKIYLREFELLQFMLRVQEAILDGYIIEDEPDNEDYPIASPFGGFTLGMVKEIDKTSEEAIIEDATIALEAHSKPKKAVKAT